LPPTSGRPCGLQMKCAPMALSDIMMNQPLV
jgi:hypothetical protein